MKATSFALSSLAIVGLSLAGCLDEAAPPLDADAADLLAPDAILPGFQLGLTGCFEGGGISMYNIDEGDWLVPGAFQYADTSEEAGNPPVLSYATPNDGRPTRGIWHITVDCATYNLDGGETGSLQWGWVAQKVLPPAWDTSGIERQFLVADFSFTDPNVVERLNTIPGMHVSDMTEGIVEWVGGAEGGFLRTFLGDTEHGDFNTVQKMKEWKALEDRTTRFWFMVEQGGSDHGHAGGDMGEAASMDAEPVYRPYSIDLVDTAGDGATHWAVDHLRFLVHLAADPVASGRVVEHEGYFGGAAAFDNFDRVIVPGPAPELYFSETWLH